ncbi:mitochondrial import receptor subunit OR translocase-domain-containing protein [Pseudoneurospora amorphoporcata]|uniref:Mitochondrial import receptor subunit OR translocase-domain-containing protein n=1 Tax=Pseudoneurospora amorphoporcata TaxID=241081 RepID=A0AAN6SFF0_9PEZI|nr:mitochondrial import receptor subunit OR translocase-domain-containing protein [Pseudoneurospora amorphoporcata]
MFGGFQPPALSREELQAAEAEATFTIQRAVFTAVALYLCSSSYKPVPVLWSGMEANEKPYAAPFVIDAVSKVL